MPTTGDKGSMNDDTQGGLLGPDGFARPHIGFRALADVDLRDARIRSGPFVLPPALARARLKRWQHFCVLSRGSLITLAVVDSAYLKLAWCQVVDLATGERFEHKRQRPLADTAVARSLWDDRTWFRAAGFHLRIHSHLAARRHVIEFDIDASDDGPEVHGTLTCDHDPETIDSMVVSLPVGRDRYFYSHKVPVPVSGAVTIGDEERTFDPREAVAILDVHKGHYPRHTWWRWATCAGRDADGRLIGINLTKNVVRDDDVWNENVVWVDGRATRLGPAVFDFDRDERMEPWRLSTADGKVVLEFHPQGDRGENIDIPGVVRSRFHQLYGTFSGSVRAGDQDVTFTDVWGLCEDHDAVW